MAKEAKGDWSKLTDYLMKIKCGEIKPKLLILTQDNLRAITGSTQKAKLYKKHTSQIDIKARAKKAGYKVECCIDDFIFFE